MPPTGILSPDRRARSVSLYRLSYRGLLTGSIAVLKYSVLKSCCTDTDWQAGGSDEHISERTWC